MSANEVVRETEFTLTIRLVSGNGPSYMTKTKKCVFCGTPRTEMPNECLANHLLDCPEAPR